jgi:hypothetical protein
MKRLMFVITLGAVLALGIPPRPALAQNADPLNGTWRLNLEKSKFRSGPAPKSQTRTYEVSGDSVKQSIEGVDSQGKPVHSGFTGKYDGKDYPVTGNPDADTISIRRIDPHSAKSVMKKDGKVVLQTTRKVSKDGKTATFTTKGTNAKGEKIDNVLVFDKQ